MTQRTSWRGLVAITALAALLCTPTGAFAAGELEQAMEIVKDPTRLAREADKAEQLFSAAVASDPRNVDAWYNLGLVRLRRGNTAGAEQAWRKALEAAPAHLPSQAQIAGIRLLIRGDESAVPVLEAIIEEHRFQAEARNILGSWALAKGNYDDARKHSRNVLLGDSGNIHALLNASIAYYREGLYDQAALVAESALEKQPRAASMHNVLGLVFLSRDNTRKATEHFTTALEIDPQNQDARLNLAALELAYGNFESALARFDEALRVAPDDAEVVLSRAVALRGLARYADAEQGYLKALALRPGYDEANYNLCVLHHQFTNRWTDAKRYCGDYLAKLDAKHPKRRELEKRVKAIEVTIKALGTAAKDGGGGGTPAP